MSYTADRCQETASITGTGAATLLGAVSQFRSFATAFGSGSTFVMYCIADQSGTNWEVGEGTFNGTTGLTRDRVVTSSNANALVSLGGGTQNVFATFTAVSANSCGMGADVAQSQGYAMP